MSGCGERGADETERFGQIPSDKLGLEAEYAVARAAELVIAPRVSLAAPFVVWAVDFNDQPRGGREEVDTVLRPQPTSGDAFVP